MGASESERQSADIRPPIQGKCLTFTVDTTSRTYDLNDLQFFDDITTTKDEKTYVTMAADGAKVYYAFSEHAAVALDETAAIAAGGTPAFANTYSDVIFDGTKDHVRWERGRYRYLVLKGSAACKLRMRASSPPSTGSIR